MKSYQERLPMIDAAIAQGIKQEDGDSVFFGSYLRRFYFGFISERLVSENYICTREEFEQRKAELQNNPKWEDAPEWVDYIAQDRDGTWRGFYLKPVATHKDASGLSYWGSGHTSMAFGCGKVIGDWQDTLEKRPEQFVVDNSDAPEMKFGVKLPSRFHKPKEQDMNDWYKNGEPPPIGSVVEYHVTGGVYVKCKVLAVDEDKLWLKTIEALEGYLKFDNVGSRLVCAAELVRPLRTETDKLVEEACKLIDEPIEKHNLNIDCSAAIKATIELLIGAGYRKIKPMTEDEFIDYAIQCWIGILSINQWREIYQAGCRFIEQGE